MKRDPRNPRHCGIFTTVRSPDFRQVDALHRVACALENAIGALEAVELPVSGLSATLATCRVCALELARMAEREELARISDLQNNGQKV